MFNKRHFDDITVDQYVDGTQEDRNEVKQKQMKKCYEEHGADTTNLAMMINEHRMKKTKTTNDSMAVDGDSDMSSSSLASASSSSSTPASITISSEELFAMDGFRNRFVAFLEEYISDKAEELEDRDESFTDILNE
jgi:hypothetical protein